MIVGSFVVFRLSGVLPAWRVCCAAHLGMGSLEPGSWPLGLWLTVLIYFNVLLMLLVRCVTVVECCQNLFLGVIAPEQKHLIKANTERYGRPGHQHALVRAAGSSV